MNSSWPKRRGGWRVLGVLSAVVGVLSMAPAPALAVSGWAPAASMSTGRALPALARLPNGKVLVAGGWQTSAGGPNLVIASAELYDPVSNTWSPARSMPAPRVGATTAPLANGRVLIAGGSDDGGPYASAWLYDPASDTWSAAPSLSTARELASATVLPSGKVLVAGGENNSGPLASAELYDPATNMWSAAADMSTARAGATATLLPSGEVLVAGGNSFFPTTPATAELYDPSSNSWSSAGTIAPMSSASTATLLPNGKVLVVGIQAAVAPYAPIAELYDPLTNTWSPAATPGTGREGGTATLLGTGEVLFAGGFNGTDPAFPAGTELYDPNADAWSSAGTMSVGRYQAAATLLPDGRVLIVGGANSGQTGGAGATSVLSSAELFTPPAYVPVLPVNTALPSISGDLTEGQTLTVSRGSWTNGVTSYSHRWQRCDAAGNDCVSVLGATTDTYTLAAGDVGSTMRVQEWATNAIGTAGPARSLASAVVSSGTAGPIKPLVSSRPRIVGTTRVGQRLKASSGAWTGTAPSFAYRWQRCNTTCVSIAGSTSSAYTLKPADARFKVRVLVTATNSAGSTQIASAQVGPITPSPSQLNALLLGIAALHGSDARISVLLKRGGHTVVFRTFGAGHAALAWYYLPRNTKLTKRNSSRHAVLIARGTANFARTTVVKLKVTLTSAGKRMLRKSHGVTLTCHGTYTPAGYPTATVTKTLKLTR